MKPIVTALLTLAVLAAIVIVTTSTFTRQKATPVSRGTDVANTISPSLSQPPTGNWNRNTAKEAPNTENRVFGNHRGSFTHRCRRMASKFREIRRLYRPSR